MDIRVLGVIPARGGSKGLPDKNLIPLLGKPLLQYTIEAMFRSQYLSRIILSTEDSAIAEFARALGVEVPFMRPPHLAADDTPMLPVVQHALIEMERRNYSCDAVMILQPTSPLRRAEHIDLAVNIMVETGADTVVSVVEIPHNFTPTSLMVKLSDGRLAPFQEENHSLRRQDKPRFYARNGPAILLSQTRVITKSRLYGVHIQPMIMEACDSVDIDTEDDLQLAEFLLSKRGSSSIQTD